MIYDKDQQTLSDIFQDLPFGNCKFRVKKSETKILCTKVEMTCDDYFAEPLCGLWKPRDKTKGRAHWNPGYKFPPKGKWKYGGV